MKEIITGDNSITFYNDKYDETYHSTSGAIEESFEKFVKPCRINDGMKILDICFGIGYNCCAALDSAKKLKIICLENDKEILEQIQTLNPKLKNYNIIKKLAKNFEYNDENYDLKLIMGDARETIKTLNDKVDAVFLDPFSPKKCPELWTKDFFADIKRVMNKNAILATYSCAGIVRRNLNSAGFTVKDGPCVGRRSPSTIAVAD